MNESNDLKRQFLALVADQPAERWESVTAQVEQLAGEASRAAIEEFLREFALLDQGAGSSGESVAARFLDLPRILAWRLSLHFRDAAVAAEQARKPESIEPGWDEQVDEYRALLGGGSPGRFNR